MTPDNISAVIVTRGNVDLEPILESLIFEDVVIVDNSREPRDLMTYGIVTGCARAKHPVIYSQDDDIIHPPENQHRIIAKYRPGVLTGCMWQEWSDGARAQGIEDGYDDLVFYGSGAVYDFHMPMTIGTTYLDHYPSDDFYRLWFSCIFGVLAPTRQLDIRFLERSCASAEYRMANLPNAAALKREAIYRARAIRDAKPSVHDEYLREHRAGRVKEHRYL